MIYVHMLRNTGFKKKMWKNTIFWKVQKYEKSQTLLVYVTHYQGYNHDYSEFKKFYPSK